jgi:esterase
MVNDLRNFMDDKDIQRCHIIGHSMGGKVAMMFAANYPEFVNKLAIIDISPFVDKNSESYQAIVSDHQLILNSLSEIELSQIDEREHVDKQLSKHIKSFAVRQFLLKNLKRTSTGFEWKINVDALKNNLSEILGEISIYSYKEALSQIPTLFMKGELSRYLMVSDKELLSAIFNLCTFITISGSGHWIHAEKPQEFLEKITKFLES